MLVTTDLAFYDIQIASGQLTALTVHFTCRWDKGLCFNDKDTVSVKKKKKKQLGSLSCYISSQGDNNKLHKGCKVVYFCHEESKMTFSQSCLCSENFLWQQLLKTSNLQMLSDSFKEQKHFTLYHLKITMTKKLKASFLANAKCVTHRGCKRLPLHL